jgi:hypothetical protein
VLRLILYCGHLHFHDFVWLLVACIILLYNRKCTEYWQPYVILGPVCSLQNCKWWGEPCFSCAAIAIDGYLPQINRRDKVGQLRRAPFWAHFSLFDNYFLFSACRHPLWRQDGSVICSAITHWLELRRSHKHILLSHLRLTQLGGPGPRIYSISTKVKVKVTLRLTVSQSICLDVEPHLVFMARCLYCCVFVGALSDEKSGLSIVSQTLHF